MVYLMQNELVSCLRACGFSPKTNYAHINEVFDVAVFTKQAKVLIKLNCKKNAIAPYGKEHTLLRVTAAMSMSVLAKNIKDMLNVSSR